jgi:hypothetical protein
MKKNKFMRLASVMLMLCLITTCAISGTFAKYTTSAKAQDSARVAKWGLTVNVTGNDVAFAKNYDSDPFTVSSSTEEKVVAPGTKGTLATAAITGKPEVSLKLFAEVDLDLGTNWVADGVYCPLVFTINGATYGLEGMKNEAGVEVTNKSTTVAGLETAVENAILALIFAGETPASATAEVGGVAKSYDFGPNSDGVAVSTITIGWEWAFDDNDNAKDTILGNLTADADGTNDPKIAFDLVIKADQLD